MTDDVPADDGEQYDADGPTDLDDIDHDPHVERAIELARGAGARDDGHYGTVLVRDDTVVVEAGNRERTDDDITLHPELTLARHSAREATAEERRRTIMDTSTEPCPMGAGGIAIAGLGAVVYSVSGAMTAASAAQPAYPAERCVPGGTGRSPFASRSYLLQECRPPRVPVRCGEMT